MYKMSYTEEQLMDKELLAAASSYAKCITDALNDALATNNTNLLWTDMDDEGKIITTFFYESSSYIRVGILEIAENIMKKGNLTKYEGYIEHLLTFEEYVNEQLTNDWTFAFADNDDVVLYKYEEEAVHAGE